MNNKQLFEQSAGKILSANQLEGVMRLHNALFEGVNPEQVADTVADAVKDALDDSLETVADQQVADDVSEVSSINVSPEDKIRLESLITSMSDTEKQAFFESLDEQQMQILTEGIGSVFKTFLNMFTKEGRKTNRLEKFKELARKDKEMTSRYERIGNQRNVSPGTANDIDKLQFKIDKNRRKMNDLSVKASKDPKEFERMQKAGMQQGSRNVSHETMENEITRLKSYQQTEDLNHKTEMQRLLQENQRLDAEFKTARTELQYMRDNKTNLIPQEELDAAVKRADDAEAALNANKTAINNELNRHAQQTEEFTNKYGPKIKEMETRLNMARQEGAGFYNGERVNNGPSVGANGPAAAPNGPYVAPNGSPFNIPPHAMPYVNPEYWKQFTKKFTTMGKVSTALLGAVSAAVGSLKYIALGGAVYGGYKLYDFFAHPDEVDLNMGDGDGTISNNVLTVIKILGGAAAGRIVAKFIGFDSTTGKNVGTLLGALLVAYFMFLNNGDEANAKDMLAEFNNSSETDQKAIMEALNTKEFANMLTDLYNENASLI